MDLKNQKLILASGSPRRQNLLRQAGLEFEIRKKEVDENYPDDLAIDEVARFLAVKKAKAQIPDLDRNEILITADTIVAFNGTEYGKPRSREDSIDILCMLGGHVHDVYTGVCISSNESMKSLFCKSVVKFSPITSEEAGWYYDTFDPSDKAGSYGIQDWLGYCKVEWINGSYTNILGLPLAQTLNALESFLKDET